MKIETQDLTLREAKLPLRPVDRETVQDRVYRQIKEMILDGEIEPGRTITIQRLSEAFQVSAMPVREALRRLMAEQALMVVSGRSVGIPTLTPERLEDLRRVRREVEGVAAAWAAQRITPDAISQLNDLVEDLEVAARASDGARYVPANHRFHFAIYELAGSPALLSIIESLWLQISPHFHVLRTSDNWQTANEAHREILNALKRKDSKRATLALSRDIDDAATALRRLLT
ncbi:GntR family transcriptional regulator [Acidiphilium sp.]|uniref:GntR family transcriptional regulator n=1 Tax=Acidiphilium sp. TaxID=527 RepID=UPI00258B27F4|nr:GntR family transcriptional regulator [Acidiphilium sp.]